MIGINESDQIQFSLRKVSVSDFDFFKKDCFLELMYVQSAIIYTLRDKRVESFEISIYPSVMRVVTSSIHAASLSIYLSMYRRTLNPNALSRHTYRPSLPSLLGIIMQMQHYIHTCMSFVS